MVHAEMELGHPVWVFDISDWIDVGSVKSSEAVKVKIRPNSAARIVYLLQPSSDSL